MHFTFGAVDAALDAHFHLIDGAEMRNDPGVVTDLQEDGDDGGQILVVRLFGGPSAGHSVEALLDEVDADELPFAVDDFLDAVDFVEIGGLVEVDVLLAEGIELGLVVLGEGEGVGVQAVLEGVGGDGGLAGIGAGAGRFLSVAAIGFDLPDGGHKGP